MNGGAVTRREERPLRADAERNRRRVLASARVLVAAHGVEVSLDEIARHAGVGVGTAYRRFPDRQALIDELLEDKISEIEALAADSLDLEPWEGFVHFLAEAQEMYAADRGLKEALLIPECGAERLAAARARIEPKVGELIARAKSGGDLRPDFGFDDVQVVFEMVSAAADANPNSSQEARRRYLGLVIDGMAAR